MNDIVVIPLGTVSPYCKGIHNCPGFLIKYKKYNILLDCGNGITRYLDFPNIFINLTVLISHMHSDHYGDLDSINYSAYVYHNLGFISDKINIYSPDINNCFNSINYSTYHSIENDMVIKIDDLNITFHDNKSHGIESYMIKLDNGKNRIVYTSDIGSTNLKDAIDFCENSDLLICESSLIRENNSKLKNHLHAFEAALLAKKSKSKQLMLTHFFPEIDKSKYLSEASEVFRNVLVAEENKEIKLERKF